jgi:hypothetical protein
MLAHGVAASLHVEAVRGHAKDRAELRERILDGLPRRLRGGEGTSPEPAPLLRMARTAS